MKESLRMLLREASIDPSTENLKELCTQLIRLGYNAEGLKDEDTERIYAVIYDKETGDEFKASFFVPAGGGYRYKNLNLAFATANSRYNGDPDLRGRIAVKASVPTEDLLVIDCLSSPSDQ